MRKTLQTERVQKVLIFKKFPCMKTELLIQALLKKEQIFRLKKKLSNYKSFNENRFSCKNSVKI